MSQGKVCCCQICHCHPKQHGCLPPDHQAEGKFYGTSTNNEFYQPLDLSAKPPMAERRPSSGAFPKDGWYGASVSKVENINQKFIYFLSKTIKSEKHILTNYSIYTEYVSCI